MLDQCALDARPPPRDAFQRLPLAEQKTARIGVFGSRRLVASFACALIGMAACGPSNGDDTSDAATGTDTAGTTTQADATTSTDTGDDGGDNTGTDGAPICPAPQQCRDVPCGPGVSLSHAADVQPIWDAFCTQCHFPAEPEPAGSLDLTSTVAYFNIVNVASQQSMAGQVRVAPGSPNDSYLWHKVMGTHLCPAPDGDTEGMPASDEPLSEISPDDVSTITEWICCGAAL